MSYKLLLATSNQAKVGEYRALFQNLPYELVTLAERGIIIVVSEVGGSLEDNARLKAMAYAARSRLLALALSTEDSTPTRFDGPPRVVALGFQLSGGKLIGPRDMFGDKSFDNARQQANDVADFMRCHGPFEPHRLPLEEMEYTTMPQVVKKLEGRFIDLD